MNRLLILIALGGIGYWLLRPAPEPPPQVDPGLAKNRKEMIRFYERAIRELEGNTTHGGHATSLLDSGTRNRPSKAHLKQIEDYKQRIAAMQSEIGE